MQFSRKELNRKEPTVKVHQKARIAIPVLALSLVLIGLPSLRPSRGQNPTRVRENLNRIHQSSQAATQPMPRRPSLSTPALFSGFAREHKLGAIDQSKLMKSEMKRQEDLTALGAARLGAAPQAGQEDVLARQVNADF